MKNILKKELEETIESVIRKCVEFGKEQYESESDKYIAEKWLDVFIRLDEYKIIEIIQNESFTEEAFNHACVGLYLFKNTYPFTINK